MSTYPYRLRSFDRANPRDIELVNLMKFHPTTMKAKGYWTRGFQYKHEVDLSEEDGDLFVVRSVLTRKMNDVLFAVADAHNRVVGWIWFYRDSRHPLPKRIVHELGLTSRNSRIYQLSYEKLMSEAWPSALIDQAQHVSIHYLHRPRKGVIVEGLRLAVARLSRAYRKLYVAKRRLVLYAFTAPGNVASAKVLLYNGFKRQDRKYSYGGVPHYLWLKIA
jgi:RimJ/RimL family protein N-acetyltransferase